MEDGYLNGVESGVVRKEGEKSTSIQSLVLSVKVGRPISRIVRTLDSKYFTAIGVIVVNMLAHHKQKDIVIAYSRNTSETIPEIYNPKKISNYKIIQAIDFMEAEGLLINNIASRHYGDYIDDRMVSTIAPTPKLFEMFGSELNKTSSKSAVVKDRQCIILKDKEGKKINYKDDSFTKLTRSKLSFYNSFANTVSVEYNDSPLSTSLDMHFKNSFGEYGRMFGAAYQNMKKEHRTTITIDGNTCIEIDFSCLHFYMLLDMYLLTYHFEGVDDLYLMACNVPSDRNTIKLAFNIFINCSSEKQFTQALQGILNLEGNDSSFKGAKEIIQKMKEVYSVLFDNSAIMANIYNGKPLAAFLQRRESAICLEVASLLAEDNIFVGTIHDSYICRECDLDIVKNIIANTYRKHMNTTRAIKISIISKENSWKELI